MNQTEFVGVDTHKNTLACYANGRFKEFQCNAKGFKEAVKWSKSKKWAIEGAYCFGRPLSAYLIENGHEVYEVNPLLTKLWRQVIAINNRKNDYGDAKVISLFAHTQPLQAVSFQTVRLKEMLTARRSFVKDRTRIINSVKMLFASRGKELPFKDLSTIKAGKWLLEQDDLVIKSYAKILVEVNDSIKKLEKAIEKELPEKACDLKVLTGINTINAATIYTETKGKLTSKESLASYSGVAPIEQSSGKVQRHKNNKGGNRLLNSLFYRMSITQSCRDEEGKRYYEKKLKEGKSKRHARKCLARRLVNKVWQILKD